MDRGPQSEFRARRKSPPPARPGPGGRAFASLEPLGLNLGSSSLIWAHWSFILMACGAKGSIDTHAGRANNPNTCNRSDWSGPQQTRPSSGHRDQPRRRQKSGWQMSGFCDRSIRSGAAGTLGHFLLLRMISNGPLLAPARLRCEINRRRFRSDIPRLADRTGAARGAGWFCHFRSRWCG